MKTLSKAEKNKPDGGPLEGSAAPAIQSPTNSRSDNLLLIEQASWRDLNALRHLEKVCFPKDAWPLLDLVGVLTLPHIVRLKAVLDDQMVGFIAGDQRSSEGMAWIATIGVLPEYQGRGIGRALLENCERLVQEPAIRLNVRLSNEIAQRLYRSSGYEQVGLWPAYYQDGEHALVMEKVLR